MGMEVQISGADTLSERMETRLDKELLSVARLWIRQALTSVLQGDATSYNHLIQELSNIDAGDPAQEANLVMTLKALSQAVSSINEHHHGTLLSCVLGMSFWNYSLDVADVLMEFIINLATSNGGFVDKCLDMLVRNFLPPSCGLPLHMDSLTRRQILGGLTAEQLLLKKEAHLARKSEILERVHLAIQQIAELVPTAALRLQPIILRRMPHRIIHKDWNALYVENMLRVESSAVGEIIGSRILMAVVDRLIEIDVEIRWEHILHEDSSKVYVFEMEMEEDEENEEDPGKPGSEASIQFAKSSDGKQSLDEVADKMDVLMELALNHLNTCAHDGRLPQVYNTLMHSFQSTILNTHKSKFTQFLIFYLCSLAPATCGANFASMLCDIFVTKSRSPNTRMSAAAYVASYLARAKYLPLFVISASLKRLVDWCLQYTPQQTNERKIINPGLHGVFYSACQAIMYVLCFRLKLLMDDPKQRLLIEELPLKKILEPSIGKCIGLNILDLTENRLQGSIPLILGDLHSLQILQLYDNNLTGTIPPTLSSCKNVTSIKLHKNRLMGTIPLELGKLYKLQELFLYQNSLSGTIPTTLSNCKSLVKLELSNNNLTGSIPYQLGSLPSLKILYLFSNRLTGEIPASLSKCSNLTLLALYSNNLTGPIPETFGFLSKLQVLNIHVNQLSGPIPSTLFNCSSLTNISASDNLFTGIIPSEIGKLTNLIFLSLSLNRLWGEIPTALYNCSLLETLDLSSNNFSGSLRGISKLKNLQILQIKDNSFNGPVPDELGNLSSLFKLHLGINHFSGTIPHALGSLSQLQGLYLQRNLLNGTIPQEISGCRQLAELFLQTNRLTGAIPDAISKMQWLTWMDLSDNMLSGPIPSSLGMSTRLQYLDISGNKLIGSIPSSVASLRGLQLKFNLSSNGLTGSIPAGLGGLEMVQFIDLSNNKLSGTIPAALGGCSNLQGLDLSGNNLQGKIPVTLSRLVNLEQFLNLSKNSLGGEIPAELGSLKMLTSLDLSSNLLNGSVPSQLGNLSKLTYLNLSHNQLEGPVPHVGVLKIFNASSFEDNFKLCDLTAQSPCHSRKQNTKRIALLVATVIFCSLLCLAFTAYYWKRKKNTRKPEELSLLDVPSDPQRFTRTDLQNATSNFNSDNIIGSSGISTVYKGVLSNGRIVAVKVLKIENSKEVDRCFNRELHTLSRIRHRNLVKILGYAWDNSLRALVLEFLPNGNLDAAVHNREQGTSLSLSKRLDITISIAQALVYLHEDYGSPIVHCDLKPANILLDEDLEAHVSDFGTAKMLGIHLQQDSRGSSTSAFQGTIGYFAPEFAYMARVTPKADVFSFGIVLMEMLTRRRPTSSNLLSEGGEGISLQQWIENGVMTSGSVVELVDPSLIEDISDEEQEEKVQNLLKISLRCTGTIPDERPTMSQVLTTLLHIKENRMESNGEL